MSGGTDEDVTPGAVWHSARLTISVHTSGRRVCVNCPPVGPCKVWWWAEQEKLRREVEASERLKALRLAGWPTTPPA